MLAEAYAFEGYFSEFLPQMIAVVVNHIYTLLLDRTCQNSVEEPKLRLGYVLMIIGLLNVNS